MKTIEEQMSFYGPTIGTAATRQRTSSACRPCSAGCAWSSADLRSARPWFLRRQYWSITFSSIFRWRLRCCSLLARWFISDSASRILSNIGGWILQLVGHVFEGRKPALADNLLRIFVAPIFLAAGVFFSLGYKPALHRQVQQRSEELRNRALTPISVEPRAERG